VKGLPAQPQLRRNSFAADMAYKSMQGRAPKMRLCGLLQRQNALNGSLLSAEMAV
jgi:hypothetical protein